MAKKTIGYMELEWTCPNCGTKNPGMVKTCKTCGAPQPENVQFGIGEQQEMLSDAQKIAQAQKGADVHCPFCGTRNPSDAKTCSQCGGDLTGGAQRLSGMVIGGAANQPGAGQTPAAPATAAGSGKKSAFRPWMAIAGGALLLVCCVALGFLFLHTDKTTGTVQSVSWERTIPVEALLEVTRSDWRDNVPQGAPILACSLKYRTQQDSPTAHSTEVCSTEVVDKGNGAAEVVNNCSYEVYDDYCDYRVKEWQQVDQAVAQGSDLQAYWPVPQVGAGEREGERTAKYTVQFQTDKGIKEFTTDDEQLFSQMKPGSQWTLEINPLGAIVSVTP